MASSREHVDFIASQIGKGAVARPMFGEYGLYLDGLLVGLICDDRLFLKPTEGAAALLGDHERAPPYPGAKPAILVPESVWEDGRLLSKLARITAAELPPPKPKKAVAKKAVMKVAKKATKKAVKKAAKKASR